jgi:hypothetical protein
MSISHKLGSALLASAIAIFAATPSRADITYDVNLEFSLKNNCCGGSGHAGDLVTITGSLETDGALGPLAASDITNFGIDFFIHTANGGQTGDFFFGPGPIPAIFPPTSNGASYVVDRGVTLPISSVVATDSGLSGVLSLQHLDFVGVQSALAFGGLLGWWRRRKKIA